MSSGFVGSTQATHETIPSTFGLHVVPHATDPNTPKLHRAPHGQAKRCTRQPFPDRIDLALDSGASSPVEMPGHRFSKAFHEISTTYDESVDAQFLACGAPVHPSDGECWDSSCPKRRDSESRERSRWAWESRSSGCLTSSRLSGISRPTLRRSQHNAKPAPSGISGKFYVRRHLLK